MSNELSVANTFLNTVLKADSALAAIVGTRIYADFAPEADPSATIYPLVLFNWQGGLDALSQGAARIFTRPLYQVRVIGRGGYGAITAAADRIDALLANVQNYALTVGGVPYVVQCYRERPMQMAEVVPGGERYSSRGGLYRLLISA